MESKLDLILRELQDLKLRAEVLETRENSIDDFQDRRVENIDMRRYGEDDIIRRIKIYPPTFNDILDPKIFIDWIADSDYYFDWYRFSKESRIRFARI